jgi:hypothetical protein
MSLANSVRKTIAGACFFLGSIWASAAIGKLIFGIRIEFAPLPPVGLERVAPVSALVTALVFCVVGALLERGSNAPPIERRDLQPGESLHELPFGGRDAQWAAPESRSAADSRIDSLNEV